MKRRRRRMKKKNWKWKPRHTASSSQLSSLRLVFYFTDCALHLISIMKWKRVSPSLCVCVSAHKLVDTSAKKKILFDRLNVACNHDVLEKVEQLLLLFFIELLINYFGFLLQSPAVVFSLFDTVKKVFLFSFCSGRKRRWCWEVERSMDKGNTKEKKTMITFIRMDEEINHENLRVYVWEIKSFVGRFINYVRKED